MTTIQSLVSRVRVVGRVLRRAFLWLLVAVVGRLEWQAPPWLAWSSRHSARGWRFATANRTRIATLGVTLLAGAGAVAWYVTRPTPHYVTYTVTPPGLTEYDDNGISSIK